MRGRQHYAPSPWLQREQFPASRWCRRLRLSAPPWSCHAIPPLGWWKHPQVWRNARRSVSFLVGGQDLSQPKGWTKRTLIDLPQLLRDIGSPWCDLRDTLWLGSTLDQGTVPPLARMEAVLLLKGQSTVPDLRLLLLQDRVDE